MSLVMYDSDDNDDAGLQQVGKGDEDDGIFELIRKVEGRPFIYNCRDPKHSKRDVINDAWNDIARGLKIKGKPVDDAYCRKKWKMLKDYYYRNKKTGKGKSGDGANEKKPWAYFSAMHRVLSSYNEENENTQSNFPGDDSIGSKSESPPVPDNSGHDNDLNESENTASNESTPSGAPSFRRAQKRKSDAEEKLLNEKILKVLEEPDEVKDQFYHFGMEICNKLRNAPPQLAEYSMIRISSLLYEIMYPPATWQNDADQQTTNESTHHTQLS